MTSFGDENADIALLTIKTGAIAPAETIGLIAFVDSEQAEGSAIVTAGYPADLDGRVLVRSPSEALSPGRVDKAKSDGRFYYSPNVDTLDGQSGSGVWHTLDGDKPRVIGVHTKGEVLTTGGLRNGGVLITKDVYDEIMRQMEAHSTTSDASQLPENAIVGSEPGFFSFLTDSGDDYIVGSYRKERILGLSGDDTLLGGAAADRLEGGAGDDLLDGGEGDDGLAGGEGFDTYSFGLGWGSDTITDPDATGRMVFIGYSQSDLNFSNIGGDLEISGGTNKVTFDEYYTGDYAYTIAFVVTTVISAENIVVDEGAGFAEFVVRLSAPSTQTVSVKYRTGPATKNDDFDYIGSGVPLKLSFAPGETTKTVRIGLKDDAAVEVDESFSLILTQPTNAITGNSRVTATIVDNDGAPGTPVIGISDPVVDEKSGEAVFVISLDRPSASAVSVAYATEAGTAGSGDFAALSGTAAFAPGEMIKTVRVAIIDDATAEGTETFKLALSNPVGATLPASGGTATIGASDQPTVPTPVMSAENRGGPGS